MAPDPTAPGGTAPRPEGSRPARLTLRPGALLWLPVVEAVLVFALVGVYAASRSPLGRYLSAGESPLFVWSRTHAVPLFWGGLAVVLLTCAVRAWVLERRPLLIQALICIEVAALAAMALGSLRGEDGILRAAHVGFQASLVLQIIGVTARAPGAAEAAARLLVPERRLVAFLSFSFVLAGAPALFDPGVHRIRAFTDLDSTVDIALSVLLPPLLSGSTGVWLGIGVAGLFAAVGTAARRAGRGFPPAVALPLAFVSVAGLYATVFVASLTTAIPWEIGALGLDGLTLPLGLLLAGALGGLTHLMARLAGARPDRLHPQPDRPGRPGGGSGPRSPAYLDPDPARHRPGSVAWSARGVPSRARGARWLRPLRRPVRPMVHRVFLPEGDPVQGRGDRGRGSSRPRGGGDQAGPDHVPGPGMAGRGERAGRSAAPDRGSNRGVSSPPRDQGGGLAVQ